MAKSSYFLRQQWCLAFLIGRREDHLLYTSRKHRAVHQLIHSPLGILVIASSIIEVSGPLELPVRGCLGDDPADIVRSLQELSKREARSGYFDLLSSERLSELVVYCGVDLTPYRNEYLQQVEALLAYGSALRHFAAQLLEAPGTANWFVDLDRRQQEWVSSKNCAPEVSSFHPDLRSHGSGITKPRYAFWTTTSVGECLSGWLHYLRWGEALREPPYYRWRLEVLPTARVYEVHGPQDWHTLCLAYPASSRLAYGKVPLETLIEPNWQAVAEDWDGIHLSVGGLLTAERVRWGIPGTQTHLFGWDVESTVWLHWVFGHIERLPDVG